MMIGLNALIFTWSMLFVLIIVSALARPKHFFRHFFSNNTQS